MSKALGCKRVHDDRIAGVTFKENASRNALIVNEEYAWVRNPFSAPEGGAVRCKNEQVKGAKIMQEALYINIIYKASSLLLFYCHVGRPEQ